MFFRSWFKRLHLRGGFSKWKFGVSRYRQVGTAALLGLIFALHMRYRASAEGTEYVYELAELYINDGTDGSRTKWYGLHCALPAAGACRLGVWCRKPAFAWVNMNTVHFRLRSLRARVWSVAKSAALLADRTSIRKCWPLSRKIFNQYN